MKFCECLGAMAKGATAVKDGVERVLSTDGGLHIEQSVAPGELRMKVFKGLDFDEEGWEIKAETREVCGIEFTRQPDEEDGEEVWVSEARGIRLSRHPLSLWKARAKVTGGVMLLGRLDATPDETVLDVLDQAKKAALLAARVLATPLPGWQPIETAPADKLVLVCWAGDRRDPEVATLVNIASDDTWLTPHGRHLRNLTHWMPLPPVPEGGA